MVEIVSPARHEELVERELAFYVRGTSRQSWYGFPCDERGIVHADGDEPWYENYIRCIENRDGDLEGPVVRKTSCLVKVDALAKCTCGTTFPLMARYLGACECPGCGRIYNAFGQELSSYYGHEEDYDG